MAASVRRGGVSDGASRTQSHREGEGDDAPTEIQYRTSAASRVLRPYSCPVAAMPDTIVTKPMAARERGGALERGSASEPASRSGRSRRARGKGRRTDATEEERVRLVADHGEEDARVEGVAGDGEGREGGEEDHVEEEEGRANGTEGGVRRAPWEKEQECVDDAGALQEREGESVSGSARKMRMGDEAVLARRRLARPGGIRTMVTENQLAVCFRGAERRPGGMARR